MIGLPSIFGPSPVGWALTWGALWAIVLSALAFAFVTLPFWVALDWAVRTVADFTG